LGIVLSILLVFRTNTAYDRWWEGRRQWGNLVNTSRNLSLMIHSLLTSEDQENRAFFARHIANFAIALKEHLRSGTKMDELLEVDAQEIAIYQSRQHIPLFIIGKLYEKAQQLFEQKQISGYDLMSLKNQIQNLADILGACERIKKTPIPFSYSIYIKTFIIAYAFTLPFGLVEEFGYFTIPVVMLIFYAFLGVELLAEEIEDPFGLDCNDLPTGTIANTITNNVCEVLRLYTKVQQEQTQEMYEKIF
jgi:putative membrane protein